MFSKRLLVSCARVISQVQIVIFLYDVTIMQKNYINESTTDKTIYLVTSNCIA